MDILLCAAMLVQASVIVDQAIEGPGNGQAVATNPLLIVQVLAPQHSGTLEGIDLRPFSEQPGLGGFVWSIRRLTPWGGLDGQSFSAGGAVEGREIEGQPQWLHIPIEGGNRTVVAGERLALLLGEIGSGHTGFETTDQAGGYGTWSMRPPLVPITTGTNESLLFRTYVDVADIQGDVNQDGQVNLQDFGMLKANFGTSGGRSAGDLDGDGRIGLSDFGILKANFGQSAAPEPSAGALLLLGVAWLALRWASPLPPTVGRRRY